MTIWSLFIFVWWLLSLKSATLLFWAPSHTNHISALNRNSWKKENKEMVKLTQRVTTDFWDFLFRFGISSKHLELRDPINVVILGISLFCFCLGKPVRWKILKFSRGSTIEFKARRAREESLTFPIQPKVKPTFPSRTRQNHADGFYLVTPLFSRTAFFEILAIDFSFNPAFV